MSAPHQKLPASNITCRYWATSGTCFFGDQCNFAHNSADRATSGRAGGYTFTRSFPKREKACKELLLTGYCKNENDGCEYNHSIPGVTRSGPPTPTTTGVASLAPSPTWTVPSSRVGAGVSVTSSTTGASIRGKGLPVTAPAFVPAAVAAAQRASLTAWGGLTPGGGRALGSVSSPASYVTSASSSVTSAPSQTGSSISISGIDGSNPNTSASLGIVGGSLESEGSGTSESLSGPTFSSSTLPASLNAQPFVPSSLYVSNSINGSTSSIPASNTTSTIGGANAPPYVPSGVAFALGAAPYVPKAKQHLHGGTMGVGRSLSDQSSIGIGVPPQQLQIRQHISQLQQLQQHQAAHFMAAAARGMGGNSMSSPYMTMEVPMVMQPFRLPDGDDPALGMTAMSPPNPAFAIPMARSNGNLPVLPAPEAMASMGIVGDGSAGLQAGSGFPASQLSYGSSQMQAPSARTQQIHQHMQKLQIQQHPQLQLPGQTPPFSLRPTHKADSSKHGGVPTVEKQHSFHLPSDMSPVSDGRKLTSSASSPNLFGGDSKASDLLPSLQADLDSQQQTATGSPTIQQQQKQQQQSPSHQQQQHLQSAQQRQQHLQQQQLLHQQHMQLLQQRPQSTNQRAITSPVQTQPRLPFRSPSPVPNVAAGPATTHGGATYFLGPGQGISNLPHVSQGGPFSGSAGRGEGRIRGQSNVGAVPLGPRFMSDQLREELRRRHALIHAQLDTDQNLVDLPEVVQRFHTLYPLEDVNREDESSSAAFVVGSMIFKGISSSDGLAYAIRRIDHRQVPPSGDLATSAADVVERWAPLARHPYIVAIRETFVSREIEDSPALFFVHDYYPGAVTLEAMHLHQEQAGGVAPMMVSEDQLWSYMVQLAAVLRAVHSAGLFFRPGGLHPSKVILPTRGRLRVSSVGVLDVLNGEPGDDPRIFQREDLAGFGRLILSLACGSVVNPSLDFMAAHYSADLVQVTQALLASSLDKSDGGGISSIRQLYHVLMQRMFGEIEQSHLQNDELMSELSKETENGRLLRILIKLGMTNEQPEDDMESGWSDTGDRYLLKLFRDFVFHQTTEDGTPLIDWTHVINCLNKLDAGVPEKMILLSRDERSMLFASYGDLKRCLESVYQELANRGAGDKGRSTIGGAQANLAHNSRLKQRQVT
ncbi:unnamed protein product [Calypogeia fissa]